MGFRENEVRHFTDGSKSSDFNEEEEMRDHYQNLMEKGWATDLVFEEIEKFRHSEEIDAAAILAFHLPYNLYVSRETFVVPGRRSTINVRFRFFPVKIVIGKDLSLSMYDEVTWSQFEMTEDCKVFDCTQCIALVPLWETRRRNYAKYVDLLERGRLGEVLIQSADNPYLDRMPGSVTGDMFEHEMAKRVEIEALSAIQLLLKSYIITSLHEVEQPTALLSRFASPADGRYFPFGDAGNIVFELLRQKTNRSLRHISRADITSALRWPNRDFSAFELQILALKRLADDGDPDLALVGLSALLECHLKSHLPDNHKKVGLHKLLQDPQITSLVPEKIISAVDIARRRRNEFVHELATNRNPSTLPSSLVDHANTDENYSAFSQASIAGFELYRLLNLQVHSSIDEEAEAVA